MSMAVNIPSILRGLGYWRFDNLLLTDTTFVDEMTTHLRQILQDDLENPNTKCEWIKYKICEFCITYTNNRNRERRALITTLEKRLKLLAEKHDLTDSREIVLEVQSLKRQLSEIRQEKQTGLFSKQKPIKLGERPTSYFLGLGKRLSKEKTITSLNNENGRTINNYADILSYEKRYFANIYTEDPSTLLRVQELPLTKKDVPQVTDGHRQIMNLPLSHRDFHMALKNLNKNNRPGSDRITPEFYL